MRRQYYNESSDDEEKTWEVQASPVPPHGNSTPTFKYSYMAEDGHMGVRESTKQYYYRFAQPRNSDTGAGGRPSTGARSGANTPTNGGEVFVRSTLGARDIEAIAIGKFGGSDTTHSTYKGRYRMWPGLVLFLLLLGGAATLATFAAMRARDKSQQREIAFEREQFNASTIADDALTGTKKNGTAVAGNDIVSDDGAIGNPTVYPASACELPNYLSKNGHIVAVSSNGTEVPLKIKGINWFGMETGQAIPFGLWDNTDNGTTAYQIASFLSRNNFNAVRLPLMAAWILENKVPNGDLMNKQQNRGVNIKDYLSLLKSIVKVLQYRNIGVLLSMHTLTFSDNGKLWYNKDVPEDKFLEAIAILTETLCSNEYWNVMGIDLKNEPAEATWGDGGAADFNAGAKRIANRMLKGCPSWMGFVEGVNSKHTMSIGAETFSYYDWFGGGLQGAKTVGLDFAIKNKVVWAPHYYTPAVYPQAYFFGGGALGAGLQGYVELSDDDLRVRVKATMDDMFGFLASETGPALLLGEFGGLYSTDLHPMKTTKRCTDFTIEVIKQPGWAGGFVWSLNPESEYQYNPADTPGRFVEGLVELDWLSSNKEFLKAMAMMDDMDNLQPFPCFPRKAAASSKPTSASAA